MRQSIKAKILSFLNKDYGLAHLWYSAGTVVGTTKSRVSAQYIYCFFSLALLVHIYFFILNIYKFFYINKRDEENENIFFLYIINVARIYCANCTNSCKSLICKGNSWHSRCAKTRNHCTNFCTSYSALDLYTMSNTMHY